MKIVRAQKLDSHLIDILLASDEDRVYHIFLTKDEALLLADRLWDLSTEVQK